MRDCMYILNEALLLFNDTSTFSTIFLPRDVLAGMSRRMTLKYNLANECFVYLSCSIGSPACTVPLTAAMWRQIEARLSIRNLFCIHFCVLFIISE